jgi:hypothetical protein
MWEKRSICLIGIFAATLLRTSCQKTSTSNNNDPAGSGIGNIALTSVVEKPLLEDDNEAPTTRSLVPASSYPQDCFIMGVGDAVTNYVNSYIKNDLSSYRTLEGKIKFIKRVFAGNDHPEVSAGYLGEETVAILTKLESLCDHHQCPGYMNNPDLSNLIAQVNAKSQPNMSTTFTLSDYIGLYNKYYSFGRQFFYFSISSEDIVKFRMAIACTNMARSLLAIIKAALPEYGDTGKKTKELRYVAMVLANAYPPGSAHESKTYSHNCSSIGTYYDVPPDGSTSMNGHQILIMLINGVWKDISTDRIVHACTNPYPYPMHLGGEFKCCQNNPNPCITQPGVPCTTGFNLVLPTGSFSCCQNDPNPCSQDIPVVTFKAFVRDPDKFNSELSSNLYNNYSFPYSLENYFVRDISSDSRGVVCDNSLSRLTSIYSSGKYNDPTCRWPTAEGGCVCNSPSYPYCMALADRMKCCQTDPVPCDQDPSDPCGTDQFRLVLSAGGYRCCNTDPSPCMEGPEPFMPVDLSSSGTPK